MRIHCHHFLFHSQLKPRAFPYNSSFLVLPARRRFVFIAGGHDQSITASSSWWAHGVVGILMQWIQLLYSYIPTLRRIRQSTCRCRMHATRRLAVILYCCSFRLAYCIATAVDYDVHTVADETSLRYSTLIDDLHA